MMVEILEGGIGLVTLHECSTKVTSGHLLRFLA
jgi:hypothetical protein